MIDAFYDCYISSYSVYMFVKMCSRLFKHESGYVTVKLNTLWYRLPITLGRKSKTLFLQTLWDQALSHLRDFPWASPSTWRADICTTCFLIHLGFCLHIIDSEKWFQRGFSWPPLSKEVSPSLHPALCFLIALTTIWNNTAYLIIYCLCSLSSPN